MSGGAAGHGGQQHRGEGDARRAERHQPQFHLAARPDAGQHGAAADADRQHAQQDAHVSLLGHKQDLVGEQIDVHLRQHAEHPEVGAARGRQKQRPFCEQQAHMSRTVCPAGFQGIGRAGFALATRPMKRLAIQPASRPRPISAAAEIHQSLLAQRAGVDRRARRRRTSRG